MFGEWQMTEQNIDHNHTTCPRDRPVCSVGSDLVGEKNDEFDGDSYNCY